MAKTHPPPPNKKKIHVRTHNRKGDNGACLTKCIGSKYEEKNSCSYRWQGFLQACNLRLRDQAKSPDDYIYDWPAYDALCHDWGNRKHVQKKEQHATKLITATPLFAWQDEVFCVEPKPKAWDLDKPNNFKGCARVPYHHQSHHLIEVGSLNKMIEARVRGTASPAEVAAKLREGLLGVRYNINDKPNVMILPMEDVIAGVLRLAPHTAERIRGRWSHAAYEIKVENRLRSILKTLKAKLANCEEPTPEDYNAVRRDLLDYSRHLRCAIQEAGEDAVKGGLVAMPGHYFRKGRYG